MLSNRDSVIKTTADKRDTWDYDCGGVGARKKHLMLNQIR